MTNTDSAPTASALLVPGNTVHLLRGSKYAGEWKLTSVEAHDGTWVKITDGGASWFTQEADAFATEAEARAEAKNRRAPRKARTARPLYGDFALLAQFHGIATDGSGRVNR